MAKILIVEDEEAISRLMRKHLSLVGHECVQAYDGTAGKAAMEEADYDLLLLDIMLPGLSGFDLLAYKKDTPVIFVTAKDNLESKLSGLNLGAEDYIVKPFEMLELIARVNVVLRRYRRNEKIFARPAPAWIWRPAASAEKGGRYR